MIRPCAVLIHHCDVSAPDGCFRAQCLCRSPSPARRPFPEWTRTPRFSSSAAHANVNVPQAIAARLVRFVSHERRTYRLSSQALSGTLRSLRTNRIEMVRHGDELTALPPPIAAWTLCAALGLLGDRYGDGGCRAVKNASTDGPTRPWAGLRRGRQVNHAIEETVRRIMIAAENRAPPGRHGEHAT
jgi:hypothetical protein